jgi:hypothetical protein
MTLPSLLAKVVSWLRAGYPDGVPEHDYVPLIALLGSQLTDDIARVRSHLAAEGWPPSAPDRV